MMISCLLKPRFTSILITVFMGLQMTACSTEDFVTTVASNIGSGTNTATDTNHAAAISGIDAGSVIEDFDPNGDNLLEVGGKLDITDSDANEAAFIEDTVNGDYGSLTIDIAGNWNYVANNSLAVIQNLTSSATLTDNLTVSSVGGTTHDVVITIRGTDEVSTPPGTNSAAVISGVNTGSVIEDSDPDGDNLLEVGAKLNITDSDAGEAAFIAATTNGNYGSLTINTAGNWNYAANNSQSVIQNLANGATVKDNLTVRSVDGTTRTVVITIRGVDEVSTFADVSLSWVAPAEREDNSPISLSEIAGYKVYYGSTQGKYPNNIKINDGSAQGHTIKNLPTGTYYFVVTTFDTDGRESQYSPEVKKIN